MTTVVNKSSGDLSVSAHTLKSLLGIKFSRAGQRHASAMDFKSVNHLLDALKIQAVERDFDQYMAVLKEEIMSNHQITINDDLFAKLQKELLHR
ncbi:hypothetical protein [Glaciecola sp. SC05]|uniref:hypothetical protein n=1 Tax=Glaciecola sp. SC05 TaxID=1987355 RepID=UPI0035291502